ncbi:response regulator [Terriglobus tenax]|uniref:response regulator n=1 Tax=Terriglobus tenax TaxID=1111115 RepID=UPI0021DF7A74|nr:response regulator [Terriglobus tenax]
MPNLLNLLIVEDEVETRFLLSQILATRGYKVRTAEDGFQALGMMRSSLPDILLSDLNMPGMSGFELLSVVRRLYPEIRVVATSGAYTGTQVPMGIAADAFYEKASGLTPLFELLEKVADAKSDSIFSKRLPTTLWVDLEPEAASDSNHVLINCPQCMRAFRQTIEEVNSDVRTTNCRYCGGQVPYAIALAIQPPLKFGIDKSRPVMSSEALSSQVSR